MLINRLKMITTLDPNKDKIQHLSLTHTLMLGSRNFHKSRDSDPKRVHQCIV